MGGGGGNVVINGHGLQDRDFLLSVPDGAEQVQQPLLNGVKLGEIWQFMNGLYQV